MILRRRPRRLCQNHARCRRERQALANGAASDTPPAAPSGKAQAQKVFADAIAADRPDDEARALAFHALVSAAAAGDQSVIIVPNH